MLHLGLADGAVPEAEGDPRADPAVLQDGRAAVVVEDVAAAGELESVQQSHFGSRFAFWHFNLKIEMKVGAKIRKTVIVSFH